MSIRTSSNRRKLILIILSLLNVFLLFYFKFQEDKKKAGESAGTGLEKIQSARKYALQQGVLWIKQGVSLQFAVHGKKVVSTDESKIVGLLPVPTVWNGSTGKRMSTLAAPYNNARDFDALCFLGRQEVVAIMQHNVITMDFLGSEKSRLINPSSYNLIKSSTCGTDQRKIAIVSPDFYALSSGKNSAMWDKIKIIDLVNNKVEREWVFSHALGGGLRMKFGGNTLGALYPDYKFQLYDSRTGNVKWKKRVSSEFRDFCVSYDGKILYYFESGKGIVKVDLFLRNEETVIPISGNFSDININKNGRYLLLSGSQGDLMVVETRKFRIIKKAILPFNASDATIFPNSKKIVTGGTIIKF